MAADSKDTAIGHRVMRGAASNYLNKLLAVGVGFLLTPFILRHLGQTDYGIWVLVGSLVSYGSIFEFGVAAAVTKYVAEYRARGHPERAHSLIATTLRLYCLFGLIASAIGVALAPLFPAIFHVPVEDQATAIWAVRIAALGFGLSFPLATTSDVLAGLHRYDVSNAIGAAGTLLSAVAAVGVLLAGGGVVGLVLIGIPIKALTQATAVFAIRYLAPELRFGWAGARRSAVRTIVSYSSATFATNVASRLSSRTDEIVIGAFLPVSAVSPYAIARRLSELPLGLTGQFMKVLLPVASELHAENDEGRLRALYFASTRLALALFLPLGCAIILLARPFLQLWVGPAFAAESHLVTILTVAGLMAVSQWPATSILQGIARHRVPALVNLCSGVANVAISIALVIPFGLTGVAMATLLTYAVENLAILLPYTMRTIGIRGQDVVTQVALPAFGPLAPMVIAVGAAEQLLPPTSALALALLAALGTIAYFVTYLTWGASSFERRTYRSMAETVAQVLLGRAKRPNVAEAAQYTSGGGRAEQPSPGAIRR